MGVPTGVTHPCPSCRSNGRDRAGDNLVSYDDGSAHCFACGHDQQPGRSPVAPEDMEGKMEFKDVARLPSRGLPLRGINDATAKMYGIRVESDPTTGEDAAFYFPLVGGSGIVGYQRKVSRKPGQRQKGDVSRVGETKGCRPFGAHVVGTSGKMVLVTEGGEDCLAAVQMLKAKDKSYRVVATLGTDGWKRNLEFFSGFEKVIIAFDQDAAGKQAAGEFAAALPAGKAVVMQWDGGATDPNALLLSQDGAGRFLDALFKAKPHRPDGIVYGEEVWRRMADYVEPAFVPYPAEWELLCKKVGGIREAEITMFTGGSSVGKTAYTRRLKAHLIQHTDWKIGEVELEERGEKTWRGVMEGVLGKSWKEATPAERREAYDTTYGSNRIFTLDHRSQYAKGQSLVAKFKHLHYAMGCKALFLDHVTLAVNEFGDGVGNPAQDKMMNDFLELVETTGVHLFLISHLRKTGQGGKSFEEGAVPSMDDLKGSGSLKQISFNILGVSRNLQHESEYERNVSQLHVLKCRETGQTGRADRLFWDDASKSLVPAREPEETAPDVDPGASNRDF